MAVNQNLHFFHLRSQTKLISGNDTIIRFYYTYVSMAAVNVWPALQADDLNYCKDQTTISYKEVVMF